MKTITIQQLEGTIENIIHDKEEVAKQRHEVFQGLTENEIVNEVAVRLGNQWVVKKETPVKFTKEDIIAVANSRFYRKTGLKLLMAWAIAILAFAMFTVTFQFIPLYAYYALSIVVTVGFVYAYSKKQRVIRKELLGVVYGNAQIEADKEK